MCNFNILSVLFIAWNMCDVLSLIPHVIDLCFAVL